VQHEASHAQSFNTKMTIFK